MIMNMEYTYKWEWYDLGIYMSTNIYIYIYIYIYKIWVMKWNKAMMCVLNIENMCNTRIWRVINEYVNENGMTWEYEATESNSIYMSTNIYIYIWNMSNEMK